MWNQPLLARTIDIETPYVHVELEIYIFFNKLKW